MENFPSLWRGSLFGERRDPMRAIAQMQREMDRMFDSFMRGNWNIELPAISEAAFQPVCDVEEKDSHYLLSVDAPGMTKDDIKVEVIDNQIHIFGERKREQEDKEKKGRFETERSYTALEQWFTLPYNSKGEGIEARIENGVLQVAIPKAEVSKAKEIKIGEGKSGIFSRLLEKKGHAA